MKNLKSLIVIMVECEVFGLTEEEEQIRKLKEVGLWAVREGVRIKVIDTLSAYGEKAIPAITEIVNSTPIGNVKEHGLDTIKKMKEIR